MPPTSRHCFPYRPHDFMYDPIFTVSGPTDHYKAALLAKMSAAKFQICPIFPNMFSDLPNYPRMQLVKRRDHQTPSYVELQQTRSKRKPPPIQREPDVGGADRSKFQVTVLDFPPKEELIYQEFPTFTIEKIQKKVVEVGKTRDVMVETKYRESTAQTDPWEPPYTVIGKGDPEILKLDFLKWGSGLPAGMHEVRLIERARMKQAWQKDINPNVQDENSLKQFHDYMQALEIDEWAFREQEISEIQELRLQLLENMLNEIHEMSKTRSQMKLNNTMARLQKEKEEKLASIKRKTARELRKLETARRGLQPKYHEVNVIDEHVDKKSEIYAPLMRHGEHPKRWHLVIDEKLKQYRAQFIGVENIRTLPKWLDKATKIDKNTLHSNYLKRRLCIRETKWTAPVLKYLHEELKNLRKAPEQGPLSLRTKVDSAEGESHTPEVEGVAEEQEHMYQSIVVLQKIIKGRSAQMMIYEGRDTCKELIQELKHSKGLLQKQKERKRKEKDRVKLQQREETIQLNMVERLQGALGKLQGVVVGSLLDFLNKELRRLLEERKAHAMCIVNEREKYVREAVEGGRRQKELRRRREHDEMFKQVVKITQDSVDVYLRNIITEGMDFCSSEEATEYVQRLAHLIEKETEEGYQKETPIDTQDELISNWFLHLLIPNVQQKIVREKIQKTQKYQLKTVHEAVYSNFEKLPAPVYPQLSPEEIVAEIIEEIKLKVEEEIELTAAKEDEVRLHDFDTEPSYVSEADYDTVSVGGKSAKSERSARGPHYKDPIELYMSHLLEQGEGEYEEGFDMFIYPEDEDPNFKSATLATIPEVDNENSVRD